MKKSCFSRRTNHTGGGCWVHHFTGELSGLTWALSDELAVVQILDNGQPVDGANPELDEEQDEQAWGYRNYIELWHRNQYHPDDVEGIKPRALFCGFTDNEADEMIEIIKQSLTDDYKWEW